MTDTAIDWIVCHRCRRILNNETWYPSRRARNERICKACVNKANLRTTTAWNRAKRERVRKEARALLGGSCQLCGSVHILEFAHLRYNDGECRSGITTALLVLEDPSRFLLLCRDCHRRPERHLAELIARRKAEQAWIA